MHNPTLKCSVYCEPYRSEPEQIHQGALDNTEPPEHPDVFLTPEKTESLISPSQVDVQADSTRNSTPAISNMMISSMSKCCCCCCCCFSNYC